MSIESIIYVDDRDEIKAVNLKDECVISIGRDAGIHIPHDRVNEFIEALNTVKAI